MGIILWVALKKWRRLKPAGKWGEIKPGISESDKKYHRQQNYTRPIVVSEEKEQPNNSTRREHVLCMYVFT